VTLTINLIATSNGAGNLNFNATPTANRPVYLFIAGETDSTGDQQPLLIYANVNGCNLSWGEITSSTIVTFQEFFGYKRYSLLLWRGIGPFPTSGTVTIGVGNSIYNYLTAFEVVNGDQNPLQVATNSNTSGPLMSTTLGAFQDPVNNLAIAGYSGGTGTITPEAGWTTLPNSYPLTAYHVGEDTSPTATISPSNTAWTSISFETKEAPPGPPPPPPPTRSTVYFFM
jgi:hypothetical protein